MWVISFLGNSPPIVSQFPWSGDNGQVTMSLEWAFKASNMVVEYSLDFGHVLLPIGGNDPQTVVLNFDIDDDPV